MPEEVVGALEVLLLIGVLLAMSARDFLERAMVGCQGLALPPCGTHQLGECDQEGAADGDKSCDHSQGEDGGAFRFIIPAHAKGAGSACGREERERAGE